MTEWSTTPPSTPGWYWISYTEFHEQCQDVCKWDGLNVYLNGSELRLAPTDFEELRWWPIPIQVPELP